MGRRYYCDYCDKTFIDDIEARKKHLNSTFHQKKRKEHYLMCRDPKTILNEEIVKNPCPRFEATGECPFDSYCKYTHYSREELWQIKLQIDDQEKIREEQERLQKEIPTLETWLEKYKQKKSTCPRKENDAHNIWWHYPEKLETLSDLPPSLIKFKPEHFKDCNFQEWG